MALADRIITTESAGNATAKNPRSSATGAGQFIDATWLGLVGRYHPEFNGLPREQVLAMRNDPALSREMVDRYSDENGATLRKAGLADTDGNRYLAHFSGPGGATSVLRADPATPVSSVLPASSIEANPFLQGKTAGWLTDWAARKVGGSAPAVTTPGAPVGNGRFGFSGIEAAPAMGASPPAAAAPAKNDDADLVALLKGLAGQGLGLAGATPAPPAAAPSLLPAPRPSPAPFDAQRFNALLNGKPGR